VVAAGARAWFDRPVARNSRRTWGFDEEQRVVLVEAAKMIPSLNELIERATRHAEIAGLWIVSTTVGELDEVYDVVEALEGRARSRARRELLESMRASLCSSMDAF